MRIIIISIYLGAVLAVGSACSEVQLQVQSGQPVVPGLKLGQPIDRPFVLDHRFSPPLWQTSICLPDDWQKTIVGSDGALLYHFEGPYASFGTRVMVDLADKDSPEITQRLDDPRVPIVITASQYEGVELTCRVFAVTDESAWPAGSQAKNAPAAPPIEKGLEQIEASLARIGWSPPITPAADTFADADLSQYNRPVGYRFKADKDKRYHVAFGLCEGQLTNPGERIFELRIEGQLKETVDTVAMAGFRVPFVRMFEATDQDGDGWINVETVPAEKSKARQAFLNALWVFDEPVDPEKVLTGEATDRAIAFMPCGTHGKAYAAPRADLMLVTVRNTHWTSATANPRITIQSDRGLRWDHASATVWSAGREMIRTSIKPTGANVHESELILTLPEIELGAGEWREFVIAFHQNTPAVDWSLADARRALDAAQSWWHKADLPYDVIKVPDPAVQALVDSSIRNIYQAREIKSGSPAFQVGPTCYRGMWVIDGAFLLEAVTLLNRPAETRAGVEYLLSHQKPDGSFSLMDRYWKETGIVLWVMDRHGQLTGDRAWLESVWPRVERAVAHIKDLRNKASKDPAAPDFGLIPAGFSDGGLMVDSEYTNLYWLLVGLKSAVAMADRLGKKDHAQQWQREYDDMWRVFRKAAHRDLYTDEFGNKMLPVPMSRPLTKKPHKALWAFMHAIHPGEIFKPDDPIMLGTLASLTDNECEGLVYGTGWIDDGLWNYFASFYGHGFAWLGQGQKAAEILYAFGNHASPLLAWREEQAPVGKEHKIVGDMPHNWASAEFIRLTQHLLLFERGDELHLLEGLPPAWLYPGAVTSLDNALTRFGPFSMSLKVSDDGRSATLQVTPPTRTPPSRIVVHKGNWASAAKLDGNPLPDGKDITIAGNQPVKLTLQLTGR